MRRITISFIVLLLLCLSGCSEEARVLAANKGYLSQFGSVAVENGEAYVTTVIPAEYLSFEYSQDFLDMLSGSTYERAQVREDGSVAYTMSRDQRDVMLYETLFNMDSLSEELFRDETVTIRDIQYNEDCSVFDIYLTTDSIGPDNIDHTDYLYTYAGRYRIFQGLDGSDVTLQFRGTDGSVIHTEHADAGK